jgi:hypothetical protein
MIMNARPPIPGVIDLTLGKFPSTEINSDLLGHTQLGAFERYSSIGSGEAFVKPVDGSTVRSSPGPEEGEFVKLARRRASKSTREKASHRKLAGLSRPQGRPLSKETTVRLTLVPTLGVLYSLLVSDTMRKPLQVLKYSDEKEAESKTNEELSTKNSMSGFSNMLNVQTVRFTDDPNVSPKRDTAVPEFNTIDEAVFNLFGLTEYSLIRVTRAAATEVGGSVLLKIETAMPGYLYLNDDEEEDFSTVEKNKELYRDSIGFIGDRPTTTFLKKRVARPRYKADMRIYLIPKAITCAIYCEERIFKRDLLRGFLDLSKGERSIISAFEYEDFLENLESQGNGDLVTKYGLPSFEEVRDNEKRGFDLPLLDQPADSTVSSSNYAYDPPQSAFPLINTKPQPRNHNVYGSPMSSPSGTPYRTYSQQVGYVDQSDAVPGYTGQPYSLPNTFNYSGAYPSNISQPNCYPLNQYPAMTAPSMPQPNAQPPQINMQNLASGHIPPMGSVNQQHPQQLHQQQQQQPYMVYMNPHVDYSSHMMMQQGWVPQQQYLPVNPQGYAFARYPSYLPNGQAAPDQYQMMGPPGQ